MLTGDVFYHETLRRYVVVFGTMFNDITLWRKDGVGEVAKFKVPIAYGPKEKFLQRLNQDPDLNRRAAIQLPRMSFEMTSFNYDGSRKLNTIGRSLGRDPNNANQYRSVFNPVPYNIGFELSVFVKNVEDGLMIVEQILPYFTPEWTNTVRLVDDPVVERDVPLVLNSVSQTDTYEGSFEERKVLIWTLNFTMQGYLFGPAVNKKLIKFSRANLSTKVNGDPQVAINVRPGLTSSGEPTSDPDQSIPYQDIEMTDDWGVITEVEDRT